VTDVQSDARDDEYEHDGVRERPWWWSALPYGFSGVAGWTGFVLTAVMANDLQRRQQIAQSTAIPGPDGLLFPPFMGRLVVVQSVAQVLLWLGTLLFAGGIVVLVLRQHSRWRSSLDSVPAPDTSPASPAEPTPGDIPAAAQYADIPAYARSVWDEPTPN
jgi:uncharacterized membrane protein YgdD (TMEM256/DUF423 family)